MSKHIETFDVATTASPKPLDGLIVQVGYKTRLGYYATIQAFSMSSGLRWTGFGIAAHFRIADAKRFGAKTSREVAASVERSIRERSGEVWESVESIAAKNAIQLA